MSINDEATYLMELGSLVGKRNHSKNLNHQCTIATGIIAVREITVKGELMMEGLGLLREVTEWIPVEVGSTRDMES